MNSAAAKCGEGRSCAVKLIASPAPAQPLQVVSRVHAPKGLREQISLRQIFDPFVPVQKRYDML